MTRLPRLLLLPAACGVILFAALAHAQSSSGSTPSWMPPPAVLVPIVWAVLTGLASLAYSKVDSTSRGHAFLAFLVGIGIDLPKIGAAIKQAATGQPALPMLARRAAATANADQVAKNVSVGGGGGPGSRGFASFRAVLFVACLGMGALAFSGHAPRGAAPAPVAGCAWWGAQGQQATINQGEGLLACVALNAFSSAATSGGDIAVIAVKIAAACGGAAIADVAQDLQAIWSYYAAGLGDGAPPTAATGPVCGAGAPPKGLPACITPAAFSSLRAATGHVS